MEAVVLGRDLDAARAQILDRMVAAVVAELQLGRGAAQGVADELVAQADAGHGEFLHQLADDGDLVLQGGGVAGAIGQEHAPGTAGAGLVRREGRRHGQGLEARFGQQTQDVPLHAEVIDQQRDARALPGIGAVGVELDVPGAVGREDVGLPGGHEGHQVLAFHAGQGAGLGAQALHIQVAGGDDAAHGAVDAQVARQGAGVQAFHAGHVPALEEVRQGFPGTPVGGLLAAFLDQQGAHVHAAGFHVFGGDAVVADERIGHAHHLSVIGGVGEHFLIAGHACIENHFPTGLEIAGKGFALKAETVFKYQ